MIPRSIACMLVPLALLLACASEPVPATCEPEAATPGQAEDPLRAAYLHGLAIAQYPTPERVSNQLLVLEPGNAQLSWDEAGRLLVTTSFPWTALGYTYDWSPENPTGEGPSEFVAPARTPVVFERLVPTEEFCKPAA